MWESGKIENGKVVENWNDRNNLVFSRMCLVERMEKWRDEKFIYFGEKKN